ncbi:DUF4855 domain-containing protein [Paenibacillus dendritiformis]|uniref:DUF4855 domain-containing protein n=1 Tax=Paenibacillus dendritiformis TaxID=130049 RepID=UPI00140B8EB5|nr:DUF4855 domain-containing protein [Paenibacillus dendritiformis]
MISIRSQYKHKRIASLGPRFLILCMLLQWLAMPGAHAEAADSDPGKTMVNLALDKPVTVSEPNAIFDTIQGIGKYGKETPLDQAGMLTDGRYGDTADWQNTEDWFVFYRKLKREVVVDLEEFSTIERIATGFGQRNDVGIAPPLYIRFFASQDGATYRYLGKAGPDEPLYFADARTATDMHRKAYVLDTLTDGTKLAIQARYIKLEFAINFFGWMDEIEIWGQPGASEPLQPLPEISDDWEPGHYPSPGSQEAAGVKDQFLWYSGPMKPGSERFTDWTPEKAEAFLAYKDIYGTIKDWFFTDILALPVTAMVTPSGVDASGNARFVTMDDLKAYLDFIFAPGSQLAAIDEAAGTINDTLKTEQTVRVTVAIPQMEESSNFGDMNGTGEPFSLRAADFAGMVDDPQSYEGRKQMNELAFRNKTAAVQWYIDEVERRFRERGFAHLKLDGFYWYHERIGETTGEAELIRETAKLLHDRNRWFTWVPYIGPGSAYQWRDLGFDAASIQPGFAFGVSKKAIFPNVAELARKTGASVEVEYDDYRTLAQYLNYGVFERYMSDAPNTYYLGAMPIVDGAYAFAPLDDRAPDAMSSIRRSVYDRLYEYVKDRYEPRFTVTLETNASQPADIRVKASVPLADGFTEGEIFIRYNPDTVKFDRITTPEGRDPGMNVQAEDDGAGRVTVRFHTDADHALEADLLAKRSPMTGAPELATLHFAANGTDAEARDFVLQPDGTMTNRDGIVYRNWGASDIVPGSAEHQLVQAAEAVKRFESTHLKADWKEAKSRLKQLPKSPARERLEARLDAAKRQAGFPALEAMRNKQR